MSAKRPDEQGEPQGAGLEAQGPTQPPEAGDEPSAGERLRRARQAQGRTVRSVSASLNLPVDKIEALEEDDDERLPPPTFVRGYLRAYARLVGCDPEVIVAAYRQHRGDKGEEERPLRPVGGKHGARMRLRPRLALSTVALAMLVVGIVAMTAVVLRGSDDPDRQTSLEPTPGVVERE